MNRAGKIVERLIETAVDEGRSAMEGSDSLAFEGAVQALDVELRQAVVDRLLHACADVNKSKHGIPLTLAEVVRANPSLREEIEVAYRSLVPHDRTPISLGPFRVRAVLGAGGQSVVVRADEPESDRSVAIKYTADPNLKPRLRDEAEILRSLKHDGIVQGGESGEEGPYAYFVMEKLTGRTLDHRFGQDRPTADESATITEQLAASVAYVHDRRLLHRDIKPKNVHWTDNGRAVLFDFGLAIRGEHWNTADYPMPEFHGTKAYMAPEHLQQDVSADGERSDVYQLGAVLHFLLTGLDPRWRLLLSPTNPSPAYDPDALRRLRGLNRRLAKVCRRGMDPDPAQRIATAELFGEQVRAAVAAHRRALSSRRALRLTGLVLFGFLAGLSVYDGLSRSGVLSQYGLLKPTVSASDPTAQQALINALAAGDLDTLNSFDRSITAPAYLSRALQAKHEPTKRNVVELFFESLHETPGLDDWFRQRLNEGLDPNLIVWVDEFDRACLLSFALRGGCAKGARILLETGACPHPYRSIAGGYREHPYFLFPYVNLHRSDRFTQAEKKELAAALLEAGASVPDWYGEPSYDDRGLWHTKDYIAYTLTKCSEDFGIEIGRSLALIESARSPIAERATERDGRDWNQFLKEMPKTAVAQKGKAYRTCTKLTIRQLMAIHGQDAYFLGVLHDFGRKLAVIHTAFDSGEWTVYAYDDADGSMGGRPRPVAVESDWQWDRSCWRELVFQHDKDENVMRCRDGVYDIVSGDFDYQELDE